MYCADVAVAMPVADCSSSCSSAARVALSVLRHHGRKWTPRCWGCARAGAGRNVRAPAPRAAAEQAQIGLALVDDIEREYFRELKAGSERGIVPAPADFFELVRKHLPCFPVHPHGEPGKRELSLFTMTHLLQLGLDLDADDAAVRLAYRSLQRIVHPDIAGELHPP